MSSLRSTRNGNTILVLSLAWLLIIAFAVSAAGAGPALFEELPLPVVAVVADLYPVDAAANRRHMHSFEAIVVEGSDHFLMLGAVEPFNRALDEAITKLSP